MDQLLLNIHPPSIKSIENFVIGDNFEAISVIKKFTTDKNLQFFYLWGVEGSGKSHLSNVVKKNNILVIEDITLSAPPYLSSQSTAIAFFILLVFLNYPLTK